MNEELPCQIVVHALADAVAALRAARDCGAAVTLVSPRGAASYAGPGWFREVIVQAREQVPGVPCHAVLDCAGAPGHALAAIRDGVEAINLDAPEAVVRRVADIASQAGCALEPIDYACALDLVDCPDAEAACRNWLAKRHPGAA